MRDALRADGSTWQYADAIAIETRDGLVILCGMMDDLIDNDNLLAIASNVAEVLEVVDALRVRGMKARVMGSWQLPPHRPCLIAPRRSSVFNSRFLVVVLSLAEGSIVLDYECSH